MKLRLVLKPIPLEMAGVVAPARMIRPFVAAPVVRRKSSPEGRQQRISQNECFGLRTSHNHIINALSCPLVSERNISDDAGAKLVAMTTASIAGVVVFRLFRLMPSCRDTWRL